MPQQATTPGQSPAETPAQPLVPTRQRTGWTAEKQRRFVETLAITGSISDASAAVFMTARSAYYLRARPEGARFAAAWDMALQQAGGRLLSHAYERALKGGCRRVWKEGELVIEETNPSDRLLMWLISRVGPAPFRAGNATAAVPGPEALAAELDALADALPEAPPMLNADLVETPAAPTSEWGD
ncbi:MAG: hypothetical protein ACK4MX_11105 [Thermaurantiacus sp.]